MAKLLQHPVLGYPAYYAIRAAVSSVLAAPEAQTLAAAERMGRVYGGAALNRSRLKRALDNLRTAFPEWDEDRVRSIARASYGHLFRLGVEIARAPRLLTEDNWLSRMRIGQGVPHAVRQLVDARPCVLISGHCGNWELLGYLMALLGFPMHALYRPLDLVPLDRWLRSTRQRRGLVLVDKFGAVRKLPEILAAGAPVGFVADQNGGDRGVMVPFFGRLTSTYKSIGLLAMQFDAVVVCGAALRRTAPDMRYEIIAPDVIFPEEYRAHEDPLFFLTSRFRLAIEKMVRAAPEQYLWMHRIWRSRPRHERLGRPFPAKLADKLRSLPWMTEQELERIVENSERDAATLARTGSTRLG